MKTLAKVLALAMVASLLIVGNAMADYVNLNRPFTPNASSDSSELSLEQILKENTESDVSVLAQSNAALWTSSEGAIDSYMIAQYRGDNGTLGIYSLLTGNEYDFTFISDSASFLINDVGALYLNGVVADTNFGQEFGFYWKNNSQGGIKSYTEDSKNTGNGYGADNNILALAYQLAPGTIVNTQAFGGKTLMAAGGDDWILAFEDLFKGMGGGADGDFNDAVYHIEDMNAATPEPGTMILLGAGLAGLAVLRKKFRK